MNHEEKLQLSDLHREIVGTDRKDYKDGLSYRMSALEHDVMQLKASNRRIHTLLIGIAIGIGVGAIMFGLMTVKELINYIK